MGRRPSVLRRIDHLAVADQWQAVPSTVPTAPGLPHAVMKGLSWRR